MSIRRVSVHLAPLLIAASLSTATSAAAAVTPLADGAARDASVDGRYVLFTDGTLLDRTTGVAVGAGAGPGAIDLAARAPKVLVDTFGALTVVTLGGTSSPSVSVSFDEQGAPVEAATGRAFLVRDGTAVIFQTATTPFRILSRDLATAKTTLLLSNATLLDASEDGRVITWSRELPAVQRPGSPLPFDPAAGVAGTAVGYQVERQAPRVVATSRWTQEVYQRPTPTTCPADPPTRVRDVRPWGLRVSQDGAAQRYAFLLQTSEHDSAYPASYRALHERVGSGAPTALLENHWERYEWGVRPDPVSGAVGAIENRRNSVFRTGTLFDDAGGSRVVAAPSEYLSYTASGVIPFDRGAGAITTFAPLPPGTGAKAFVDVGDALEPSATPWTTLPRSADAIDGDATRATVVWAPCDDLPPAPVRGVFSDYSGVVAPRTRNSAGIVWFTQGPAGKVTAKTLQIQVKWLGIPLWTRTVAEGPVALPPILAFVPGYTASLRVKLADGATVSGSVPLWRSR